MIQIKDNEDLGEFLRRPRAILFFDADWSGYAKISKQMVEFVEWYIELGKKDVSFYHGQFEDGLLPIGKEIQARGVPETCFAGNGSIAFFGSGKYLGEINSVIGAGNWAVWRNIENLFGIKC